MHLKINIKADMRAKQSRRRKTNQHYDDYEEDSYTLDTESYTEIESDLGSD